MFRPVVPFSSEAASVAVLDVPTAVSTSEESTAASDAATSSAETPERAESDAFAATAEPKMSTAVTEHANPTSPRRFLRLPRVVPAL